MKAVTLLLAPFLLASAVLLLASPLVFGGVASLPPRVGTLLLMTTGLLLLAGIADLPLPGRGPSDAASPSPAPSADRN